MNAEPDPSLVWIEGRCKNCGRKITATFRPPSGMHAWFHVDAQGREECEGKR